MEEMKVIARKNLPVQMPITWTIVVYLLMDKFGLWQGIYLGAVIVLLALVWLVYGVAVFREEHIDILKG